MGADLHANPNILPVVSHREEEAGSHILGEDSLPAGHNLPEAADIQVAAWFAAHRQDTCSRSDVVDN